MKSLTRQNPEQLFVTQELIHKVKSKCCGIKDKYILEYFDYHNKPSYIVNPFYNSNEGLKQFGVMIGAKPIEKSIEDFQEIMW